MMGPSRSPRPGLRATIVLLQLMEYIDECIGAAMIHHECIDVGFQQAGRYHIFVDNDCYTQGHGVVRGHSVPLVDARKGRRADRVEGSHCIDAAQEPHVGSEGGAHRLPMAGMATVCSGHEKGRIHRSSAN
jgi:hypothetical protein